MSKRQATQPTCRLQMLFGRQFKRARLGEAGAMCQCTLQPMQPQQELGPFWLTNGVTNGCISSLEQPMHPVEAATCSLGSWALVHELSLVHRCLTGAEAEADDDTQDTATSSGSEGCAGSPQQQHCAPARTPRAAATGGEEDSITSNQPPGSASAAFSFGSRPYQPPSLKQVLGWGV